MTVSYDCFILPLLSSARRARIERPPHSLCAGGTAAPQRRHCPSSLAEVAVSSECARRAPLRECATCSSYGMSMALAPSTGRYSERGGGEGGGDRRERKGRGSPPTAALTCRCPHLPLASRCSLLPLLPLAAARALPLLRCHADLRASISRRSPAVDTGVPFRHAAAEPCARSN